MWTRLDVGEGMGVFETFSVYEDPPSPRNVQTNMHVLCKIFTLTGWFSPFIIYERNPIDLPH